MVSTMFPGLSKYYLIIYIRFYRIKKSCPPGTVTKALNKMIFPIQNNESNYDNNKSYNINNDDKKEDDDDNWRKPRRK